MNVSRPGIRAGFSRSQSSTASSRGRGRAELDPERVVDAGEELDVGAVRLPRPLADPEHVRRAVVPVAGQRVLPRQPLLVVEQQALVARPDVDLVELRRVDEVDPAGPHEAERALDLDSDLLVALPLGRAGRERLVPHLHLGQVGEAALREGAEEIQRRRRLVVARAPSAPGRESAPRPSARRR